MPHSAFVEAMRRVVSGENANGRSLVVIDGPPSGELGAPGLGGLYEIWHEAATGAMTLVSYCRRRSSRLRSITAPTWLKPALLIRMST